MKSCYVAVVAALLFNFSAFARESLWTSGNPLTFASEQDCNEYTNNTRISVTRSSRGKVYFHGDCDGSNMRPSWKTKYLFRRTKKLSFFWKHRWDKGIKDDCLTWRDNLLNQSNSDVTITSDSTCTLYRYVPNPRGLIIITERNNKRYYFVKLTVKVEI